MRLSVDDERTLIVSRLAMEGAPSPQRELQADWLVEGDLRGHPSHGIQRLPTIVLRIRGGLADPAATGSHRWRATAALEVDGQRGLGPCVAVAALDAVCARAQETGVAVAAIHGANHLGILAPYVERVAARGLIGCALTTSEALVHPWGGSRAMLGTNPLAIAVPAEPEPLVLDMATGAVSMGRILSHRHRDEPLEPGWAVDANGRPTLDAEAAAVGAISPFGGAKGYALGLALEIMVGTVTGAALGREVAGTLDSQHVSNKGDVVLCMDPRAFGVEGAIAEVSRYLREVRETPPREGHAGPAIPGDGARARRARSLADGVDVPDSVLAEIEALGAGSAV